MKILKKQLKNKSMKEMKDWHPSLKSVLLLFAVIVIFIIVSLIKGYINRPIIKPAPEPTPIKTVLYTGKIYHLFFHSLIVYPELAFDGTRHAQGYQDYMVTKSEFDKILPKLYEDGFILIDPHILYSENASNTISQIPLYLPEGKRPLILSQDDVSYYSDQDRHGFANKLVIDSDGSVATEITDPQGNTMITHDGDVVPIVDSFVEKHPDFSWNGAKGIIALTGYEGVLGYRTNRLDSPTYLDDVHKARSVVRKMKRSGWQFASHSYSHDMSFRDESATEAFVKYDTDKWQKEVEPIVGHTDIYIGPFGQVFQPGNPRREYILSKGYKMLFGVGMDLYLKYFPTYMMMDRANIDGIRLIKTPDMLREYFDPNEVLDPERGIISSLNSATSTQSQVKVSQ